MGLLVMRRAAMSIPILFIVVTVVFFAFQLIPGDPARMYAGADAPESQVEALRKELGLDQPVRTQYVDYMSRLIRGDLGKSIFTRRPVITEIAGRLGNTLKLSAAAIGLATICGVSMGAFSALRKGTGWDHGASVVALAGISMPVFWLGQLFITLFSVNLGILPSAGHGTWQHYIMPTVCLSVYSMAFITRMTRSSMLETIGQDYVRTARAKGVKENKVLLFHSLRNALLPVVTVVGLRFGYMVGGAVVVEEVFAWQGMGRLLITAVGQRDLPVVQGVLLVFASAFVFVNLGVDIAYMYLDPRIRYQ